MKYRVLNIENGNGDIWTLTDKDFKVFASDLSGFGASRTLSTIRLGDEALMTSNEFNLIPMQYVVNFYDSSVIDKYQKYQTFIRFLSAKPLYQQYIVPSSMTVYRRRVEIISIDKTEVGRNNVLECPVVMQPLTFWEDNESHYIETDKQITTGKKYPLDRPYAYGASSFANMPLQVSGLLDSPLKISILGTCTNPQYNLYDEFDNLYGTGRFIGTFDEVYVDSEDSRQQIRLVLGGASLDNAYSYQDLTVGSPNEVYVTFLKLKQGKSKMSFVFDPAFDGRVLVEWRNRYVSV